MVTSTYFSASGSGESVGDLSEQCDFSALTCVAPQCWIVCAHSVLVHAECISCPSVHCVGHCMTGLVCVYCMHDIV